MSYLSSSHEPTLIDGHILRAVCGRSDGSTNTSQIDLDTCIGNLNGFLAWDMQNFSQTAEDIRLEEGGRRLTCLIKRADGGHRERQGITLDKIHNFEGNLQYRLD